jgi:hypothetical protein
MRHREATVAVIELLLPGTPDGSGNLVYPFSNVLDRVMPQIAVYRKL